MKPFDKLERWSERHHSVWMDALRLVLGLILTIKGFMFIMDTASLVKLLNDLNFGWDNVMMAHVIAIMHLLAGFLIIIGLATRISCLLMIPILLGAVFFANLNSNGEHAGELVMSIFTLCLLIFFFFKGSGRFSSYYYLINSKRSRQTDESDGDYKGGSSTAPMDKEANIV